jgi:hypothetical protein
MVDWRSGVGRDGRRNNRNCLTRHFRRNGQPGVAIVVVERRTVPIFAILGNGRCRSACIQHERSTRRCRDLGWRCRKVIDCLLERCALGLGTGRLIVVAIVIDLLVVIPISITKDETVKHGQSYPGSTIGHGGRKV